MGREIRRVPPNWKHPQDEKGDYISMYDHDYESKAEEWIENFKLWENGEHPAQERNKDIKYFWEWENPPDEETCRPRFCGDPTWYQVYETVSEGTPVTPPFETKDELIDYLVENGDFWDQKRGDGGWSRKAAEQFVENEWAPSMIAFGSKETGYIIKTPRDGCLDIP